jgi:hypothetical protein
MKKLERVKEVSVVDEFFAVHDLLTALGYNTESLNMLDMAYIKHDVLKAIEECEDPLPDYINWKNQVIEEGDLPR